MGPSEPELLGMCLEGVAAERRTASGCPGLRESGGPFNVAFWGPARLRTGPSIRQSGVAEDQPWRTASTWIASVTSILNPYASPKASP